MRLAMLASFLLLVCVIGPNAAQATCPVDTVTHGLSGTFQKLELTGESRGVIEKVSLAAGYSVQLNLLPTSDCQVRWVSLIAAAQLGGGQAAGSSATAFTLTPLAGLGFYNSIVRVLLGFDFLNLTPGNITGLLTGNPVPGNLALFVGTGLQWDLSTIVAPASVAAERIEVRPALPAPPPGFVRP